MGGRASGRLGRKDVRLPLQDVLAQPITTVGLLFLPFAVSFAVCSLQAQKVLRSSGRE